jgi:glutamate N-acetyltransferase/amino-acid N-acetyltransferase
VKTALHGGDPNFGRVLQAAGQAMAGRDGAADGRLAVDLEVEGRRVVSAGTAVELGSEELAGLERAVRGPEVEYVVGLPGTGGETEVFFSDLGHDYVSLNAEYTT